MIIKSLFEEDGTFYIYSTGRYPSFSFKGSPEFLERIKNLVKNYGLLGNGKIKRISSNWLSVLAPLDRIKQAIYCSFENEIRVNYNKFPNIDRRIVRTETDKEFKIEIAYNEKEVAQLAKSMTTRFLSNNVIFDVDPYLNNFIELDDKEFSVSVKYNF